MATPTAPTLTGTGAGTKNMQAGTYSVRIVPRRVATGGYNNPSPKTEVTITAKSALRITFPAMDTTSGQDAWDVALRLTPAAAFKGRGISTARSRQRKSQARAVTLTLNGMMPMSAQPTASLTTIHRRTRNISHRWRVCLS